MSSPTPHLTSLHVSRATLLFLALASAGWTYAQDAPHPVSTTTASNATSTPAVVTVQAGDTAYSIARRAGITVEQLLNLNGLSSPALKVGQVLRVSLTLQHTVQPGETLYALARRYAVSVDAILTENGLPSPAVLSVGQVLRMPAAAKLPTTSSVMPAPAVRPAVPTMQGSATTTVTDPAPAAAQPTLPNGVNGSPFLPGAPVQTTPVLNSPDTLPGVPNGNAPQPLSPAPVQASAPSRPASQPLPANWRDAALAMLGTPYVYGGATRTGTDCSGLVVQVFSPLGIKLPRVSAAQAQVGQPVNVENLQPGDLVFFDTEGQGRVSHVGIYLGDDQFVNANSYAGKVVIDTLMADRYWKPRYLGARRILGAPLAQQP